MEDNSILSSLFRCYYGRCYGMYEGETCSDSRDCMPGFYCKKGKARPYKVKKDESGKNKRCETDESCGRMARCASIRKENGDLNISRRECVPYFSLEDGTEIYVRSEYDVFLCKSLAAENDRMNPTKESLSNFRVNEKMICGRRYKSINKGINCYEYSCDAVEISPNSNDEVIIANVKAECDCFMDATGIPVCGPLNGDIEFDQYRAAFRSYMEQSKYCHSMRDLEFECGDKRAYYNLYIFK